MSQSTRPAYITSLIRHFEDLRDGTHGGFASKGSPFREGSGTADACRPPGFERNIQKLAVRHRTGHRIGITAHIGWRAERILDVELA